MFPCSDGGEDAVAGSVSSRSLPPRPLPIHQRRPSHEAFVINLSGVKDGNHSPSNSVVSVTPPSVAIRKWATTTTPSMLEADRNKFHSKSQQFLQSVTTNKRPTQSNSPLCARKAAYGLFRDSPKRASSLESIGDASTSSDEDDELRRNRNRVELQGMNLLDDMDHLDLSAICVDDAKHESAFQPVQRQIRFNNELQYAARQARRADGKLSDVHRPILDVGTSRGKQQSIRDYALELEKERESLIKQWRAEFEAELAEEAARKRSENPLGGLERWLKTCQQSIFNAFATLEILICNMPLPIAASALSWATLGVVWFKFGAEHLTMYGKCQAVHFHDPRNTYPHEFPGSFSCDQSTIYRAFLNFHFGCHILAAILASFFLMKICLAWRAVVDDLTNPVTATPVGVICITLEILFAAAGEIGEIAVLAVTIFHALFSLWYLYVAVVKFKLLPDPSWFPGTVGIGYAAVKAWLVCNAVGKFVLGVRSSIVMLFCFVKSVPALTFLAFQLCLSFFFALYFVSIIRVALNTKIAAPVCWMQLSAPSIALYASTIMSQPTAVQEALIRTSDSARHAYFAQMHTFYLPFQHGMFALCLIGMASSLHSLWTRWDALKQKPFSPAHLAFGFPTLSHTNAIQAYRSSVNAFSAIPRSSSFHLILYTYWITCLVAGSLVNLILSYKAFIRLPEWTNISIVGEVEPPNPSETIMSEMLQDAHEVLDQPFVSPAVLQANETGTLIRVRRGTEDYRRHGPYIRTRHVASFGFDPSLSVDELRDERARLFDWVARNAPRTRNRTLSIPLFMKLKDKGDGEGMYGTFGGDERQSQRHRRSQTMGDIKS